MLSELGIKGTRARATHKKSEYLSGSLIFMRHKDKADTKGKLYSEVSRTNEGLPEKPVYRHHRNMILSSGARPQSNRSGFACYPNQWHGENIDISTVVDYHGQMMEKAEQLGLAVAALVMKRSIPVTPKAHHRWDCNNNGCTRPKDANHFFNSIMMRWNMLKNVQSGHCVKRVVRERYRGAATPYDSFWRKAFAKYLEGLFVVVHGNNLYAFVHSSSKSTSASTTIQKSKIRVNFTSV
jgi:hypothetical protein